MIGNEWSDRLRTVGKMILGLEGRKQEIGEAEAFDQEEFTLEVDDAYRIRRIDNKRPEVQQLLKRLQKVCLPDDRVFNTDQGYWWVAYHDVETIAFAGMVPSSNWTDVGYLCRAGVVPDHRGRGLQKRLIRARMQSAKRIGWRWLITDTRSPESANSLISCGFKMYQPSNPWAYRDSCYWRKEL